jgi:ribonuclease E
MRGTVGSSDTERLWLDASWSLAAGKDDEDDAVDADLDEDAEFDDDDVELDDADLEDDDELGDEDDDEEDDDFDEEFEDELIDLDDEYDDAGEERPPGPGPRRRDD